MRFARASHAWFVVVLAVCGSVGPALGADGEVTPPARTVWEGVYGARQAARGEDAFNSLCLTCHRGGFEGRNFMQRWGEDKVASFYNFISTKMPISSPGIATQQQYLDITAYVLSSNRFPTGEKELEEGDLGLIEITGKNGPQPVPDGSLVWSVGCLRQGNDDVWSLTTATEPIRTREAEQPAGGELAAAQTKPPGSLLFRFLSIESLRPANTKNQRIMARGFLDRQPRGDRLVATALIPLGFACTE